MSTPYTPVTKSYPSISCNLVPFIVTNLGVYPSFVIEIFTDI
ncbi:hypothetical protein bthur0014_53630 [Bacillus thuringiensis IBL 4222]|nr:hypothetical protein bthur0010_58320 [Bacillus thuringiensis serovar pondicheriensis BGSC 4BA1]EEM99867.1 hypothetical protein bthur0014_53630 [Bacillus thuringiensis IBL 4222]